MTKLTRTMMTAGLVLGLMAAGSTLTAAAQDMNPNDKPLVDLNTATEGEIAKLPSMNAALAKAELAKRPFPTIVEFDAWAKGQGLTAEQLTELYKVAFIRINLNTGKREEMLLIPGVAARFTREFFEYRPWTAKAQFDKEIGKYVGAAETARLWKYFLIDKP
jgi:DNA uptake protein ComE-like DNA-binding protein